MSSLWSILLLLQVMTGSAFLLGLLLTYAGSLQRADVQLARVAVAMTRAPLLPLGATLAAWLLLAVYGSSYYVPPLFLLCYSSLLYLLLGQPPSAAAAAATSPAVRFESRVQIAWLVLAPPALHLGLQYPLASPMLFAEAVYVLAPFLCTQDKEREKERC